MMPLAWNRAFVCVLLGVSLAAHAQDDKRAGREREALRRSQQALRSAQEAQAVLLREKASLVADKAKLDADAHEQAKALAGALAQGRSARAEHSKIQVSLSATESALRGAKAEAAAQHDRADGLDRSLAEARATVTERTAANATVSKLLAASVESLATAERKNRELYAIARQLVDEMRTDATGHHDPILGFSEVQTENKAEAIRSRMDAQRIISAAPAAAVNGR